MVARLQNIWGSYIVQRFVSYFLTIIGSVTIAFIFFRSMPGDPLQAYILSMQQTYSATFEGSAEMIAAYRREFGLEGNLFEQYINYMRNVLINRDLGPSILAFPTRAQDLIFRALPWTIGLFASGVMIAWLLGLLLGSIVGYFRGTKLDSFMTGIAIGLAQIPQYFIALLLLFIFAYTLAVLPARDAYNASLQPSLSFAFASSVLQHSILPGLSLVIVSLAAWMLRTRALIITILGEDYLTYAEAKGLKRSTIMSRYALRNALLPELTGLAFQLGAVLNGAFLVEWLFNYPGMGTLFVTAVSQLDYNVMQGIVIISIVAVLTAILIVDLILPFVDPRIRRT